MISDLKELYVQMEELNGIYSKKLDEMTMYPEKKEEFFNMVKEIFRQKVEEVKEVAPIDFYKFILQQNFYQVKKLYRNQVNKHNKKIIRNRGDVVWNGSRGTYRREK